MNAISFLKPLLPALALALAFALSACQPAPDTGGGAGNEAAPPVMEVTFADHAYLAPDSIPSGWVTFQMKNEGEETHELILNHLPEDKTFEDLRSDLFTPLDSLQQLLIEGTLDSSEYQEALQKTFPDWYGEIELVGSGGLVGPGKTAQTTLHLKPGNYAMMCSNSSPNGRKHYLQGMAQPITVTESASGAEPPEADVTMRSKGREVSVEGTFTTGKQTVALHVGEPPENLRTPYSWAFLAPLSPETSVKDFQGRDFTDEEVHSIEFLGGVGVGPSGGTGYVTVDLKPGDYAWVLYNPSEESIVKEVTVD